MHEGDSVSGDDSGNDTIQLLRTMQQHHVALSAMADTKANILIGATLVVFALIVRESSAEAMTVPLLVLAVSSFLASTLCVLAVIPSIGTPKRATEPNALFFGAFAELSESDFQQQLTTITRTNAAIHRAMIRDIHQLGCVLKHKKYRYLAWGYRVFILGLAATLVLYTAERLV